MTKRDIRELLHLLAIQNRKEYATKFRDINLHIGQEQALCYLWRKDGISQTELRKQMGCEASTLSNMIRRLEQDKVVYRKKDAYDGRTINVFLTNKGRQLETPITEIWEQQQKKMFKGISEEEQSMIHGILEKILKNFEK